MPVSIVPKFLHPQQLPTMRTMQNPSVPLMQLNTHRGSVRIVDGRFESVCWLVYEIEPNDPNLVRLSKSLSSSLAHHNIYKM